MVNRFVKPCLPRSLFGRAVVIMIVPIILIETVVAVVFVERLFRDVTKQMVRTAAIDLGHVLQALPDRAEAEARATALRIDLSRRTQVPGPDVWRDWFDYSGTSVMETLRETVPGVRTVDLGSDRSNVLVTVARDGLLWDLRLSRNRVAATNPHQLLVIMVLSAGALSLIAIMFLRNQMHPVRRLARAAEAFGKGQSLALHPRGATEVRAATEAFLAMRTRLNRQIEQRTTMLSGVSHDLRTLLTRLRLSLSVLDEDNEDIRMMHCDLDDMEGILDEFLAFARGNAGEQIEPVHVRALVRALVRDARRSGQNVDLVFNGQDQEDPAVDIRPGAVRRALSNLLSNAWTYGEKVRLSVCPDAGYINFVIEDDGPGIAQGSREDAMRPFTRLEAARTRDTGGQGPGVGLGMAIAADIAHGHGGALTLGTSTSLGGLRANLRLPRRAGLPGGPPGQSAGSTHKYPGIQILLAAALLTDPVPGATAETIVPPAEFQHLSEGRTFHFSYNGHPYGAEQYFTRRESLWQFANGDCEHGRWFPHGALICFVYETDRNPLCWTFLKRDDGAFVARPDGATADSDLLLERTDTVPLACPGPKAGA
ncbi:MAG: HAMP domain-containing protein [Rhodobacteraceae bacterium]|nr:HAMP domain-containing protein [Paracoccaceae bacterium]